MKNASLLERASQVYDFGAHVRTAPTAVTKPVPTPVAVDPVSAPADNPVACGDDEPLALVNPAPVTAPPPVTTPAPGSAAPAAIDRIMLAQKGMIVPGAPVGPLAEEFRLIKRQLLLTARAVAAGGEPEKARLILVCSGRPGDGKTFCAINLALSLAAERDREVLLVDADFAKPDVMYQLGLEDGPGLLDALADPALDPQALVIATDVPQLSILPAGKRTHDDTELLASDRTRVVVSRLLAADPRRIVVLDSPPALAASPAGVLAMQVGQVMLVVRADRTPEGELREAVALLDGCEHVQLVLNAVSFSPGGQRFGTYYGQEG